MSTRVLRKLKGDNANGVDILVPKPNDSDSDEDETEIEKGINRFTALVPSSLEVGAEEEGDEETDETNQHVDNESEYVVQKKSKKKKKKVKTVKQKQPVINIISEEEFLNDQIEHAMLEARQQSQPASDTKSELFELLRITPRLLNATNELRKKQGLEYRRPEIRRPRGKHYIRPAIFVIPQKHWPPPVKTGISMTCTKCHDSGKYCFRFEHTPEYRQVQKVFMNAVDVLNFDAIGNVIQNYPYHVDSLIHLSQLYRLNGEKARGAELIERVLYCLESAFHLQFNFVKNNGLLYIDYRYQENRAFFVALFRHMLYVEECGCYRTALELAKVILSLDIKEDPMAILLLIDFYALLCEKYSWLVSFYEALEPSRNLSQLPNFAYSMALTCFLLSLKESASYDVADKYLQKALIMFPGMLMPLLDKCSVEPHASIATHHFFTSSVPGSHSESLCQLIDLYVRRNSCLWKKPEVLDWLMKNAVDVIKRVDQEEPFVEVCTVKRKRRFPSTPLNILRHVVVSDIKGVSATFPPGWKGPNYYFDPVPPLNGVNIYSREVSRPVTPSRSQNVLLLFLQSLLPSFGMAPSDEQEQSSEADHPRSTRAPDRRNSDGSDDGDDEDNNDDHHAQVQDRRVLSSNVRHSVQSVLLAMRNLLHVMQTPTVPPVANNDSDANRDENTDEQDTRASR